MLIQFSVRNFKTFRGRTDISLLANYNKDYLEVENVGSIDQFNLRVLKSAAIFGANASGKSKFLEALVFMKSFAITSSKESQSGEEIEVDPFRLNTDSIDDTTEFEVIFTKDDVLYRYGFEVNRTKVFSEWLYQRPKTKEIEIFYREGSEFNFHPRKFSRGSFVAKEKLVRDNALLLSLAAQFNDPIARKVISWFGDVRTLSGLTESGHRAYTVSQMKFPEKKASIINLLKAADLAVEDVDVVPIDIDNLPNDMPVQLKDMILDAHKKKKGHIFSDVVLLHRQYDAEHNYVGNEAMSLDDDCSSGTSKFFALTGPILDCLANGYTLLIDELDSKLHPNLVDKILSLFNSKVFNPNNAQLIFNSQDTNILSSNLLRKDQIWFTEKNRYGEARIYSLADFKSSVVRSNEAFEDNYIKGKYGAVPYLENFDSLTTNNLLAENEK